jgi:hypothetical protein
MLDIKIIVGVIVISSITAYRWYQNYQARSRSKNTSKYLEENPEYAKEYAKDIDMIIKKEKVDNIDYIRRKLPNSLPKNLGISDIKLCLKIDQYNYLFTTLTKYIDLDGNQRTLSGKRKTANHFFDIDYKLVIEPDNYEVKIYSTLAETTIDKNIRLEFANELLKHLKL